MLFFMRYQNKEFRVRVESRHGRVFVRFNDESEQAVDLVYYGNDCSFVQSHQVFSATVTGAKNDYTVWKPVGNLNFHLESEYRRIVGILRGQDLGDENNVYAKMPGKIVKILAKPGTRLEKGQPVIVMEAMKMENEIRSPIAGIIRTTHVSEGQAVETGELLIELDAAEPSPTEN